MKYAVTIRHSEKMLEISHIARLLSSVLVPPSAVDTAPAQRPSSEAAIAGSSNEPKPQATA
ncbi:MAG TPA: hypothetical protein VGX50_19495 [Longimicrobium sp.]|nr:hypothetical protein [Longimicrobium sp.]